jgi:hypothetical protein
MRATVVELKVRICNLFKSAVKAVSNDVLLINPLISHYLGIDENIILQNRNLFV